MIQLDAASSNISGTDLSQGAWGSVLSDFAQEAWPPGLPGPTMGDLELPGCPVLTGHAVAETLKLHAASSFVGVKLCLCDVAMGAERGLCRCASGSQELSSERIQTHTLR